MFEHLKTPFQPKPIDYKANKDVADKILRLYETSFEKAFNTAAINDQGLFYRQLGMPEKALESFEYLIKNEDEHSSRVDIASAFEQAGLCLQQILNKQPSGDQRKDMEQKMKMYWKSSIEISCNLVSKVPSMNKGWKSPSALKSTIGYANTKDDKLDLLFLYKKMGCNEEALGVLNELETLPKTEGEKIKILKGKVDNYCRLGLYDDAMITLSRFPNVLDVLGKELCVQIYVEAGIDDLKTGYSGKARGRIQRAFDVLSSPVSRDKKCDIFMLCSTDYENKGRKLLNIINLFGLDATLNSDRVLPGTPELSGITNEMKKSKHFVIISDFNAGDQSVANHMQHMTAQLQAIVEERKAASSGVMVLKAKSHDPLPDMFRAYQRIDMDLNAVPMDFPEEFTKDENCSQGVKEIVLTVLLTS